MHATPHCGVCVTLDTQVERVLHFVTTLPSSVLAGWLNCEGEPHRKPGTPWYMSRKEFPAPVYPPFPHGSAYIVSRDVGVKLKELKERGDLEVWKLEDVSLTLTLTLSLIRGLEARRRLYGALGTPTQGAICDADRPTTRDQVSLSRQGLPGGGLHRPQTRRQGAVVHVESSRGWVC